MRWFVTLTSLAIFLTVSHQVNADWGPRATQTQAQNQVQTVPTTPQVPMPQGEAGLAPAVPPQVAPPQPSGSCNGPNGCGTDKRNCVQKILAWATYRPSSGDALPLLKPHPYIGPFTGTFVCTSVPFCPTAGNCNSSCGKNPASAAKATPVQNDPMEGKVSKESGAISVFPRIPEAAPTEGKSRVDATLPPVYQVYPPRGCQGGSVQLSDPTFPGSARMLPEVIEWRQQEAATPVESVELKPIGCNSNCDAPVSQTVFIAAVPVARQIVNPMDVFPRPNSRP
jgi:hypothetical protein